MKGQLLQSFSIVLGPTLPHIAAILTFLLYISTGNVLVPQQVSFQMGIPVHGNLALLSYTCFATTLIYGTVCLRDVVRM